MAELALAFACPRSLALDIALALAVAPHFGLRTLMCKLPGNWEIVLRFYFERVISRK